MLAQVADAERERRQEITAKARRAAADMGAVRGAAAKLTPKRRAEAKRARRRRARSSLKPWTPLRAYQQRYARPA
jgi:hypothetical protein